MMLRSVPTDQMVHSISLKIHGREGIGNGSMVGRGTQQDLYGGPPLKIIKKNEGKLPDSMEMEISGVKIQLRFAEKESPGIKDRVIEILSDEYEKRRLGETTGEKLGKI